LDDAIQGLLEIALPEPVSYAPQTIGWYVLLALLLAAAIYAGIRWGRAYRANRYRREALVELSEIAGGGAAAGAQLSVLVKRTALGFAPRGTVAELSGDAWLEWLDGTMAGREFQDGPGRLLPALAYQDAEVSDTEWAELTGLLRRWIRRHRADL